MEVPLNPWGNALDSFIFFLEKLLTWFRLLTRWRDTLFLRHSAQYGQVLIGNKQRDQVVNIIPEMNWISNKLSNR